MKKTFLLSALILCNVYIFGQEKHSIQFSPTNITNMPLGISYQYALNNFLNIESTLVFSYSDIMLHYYDHSQFTLVEISPGFFINEPKLVSYFEDIYELGFSIGLLYRPFGYKLKGFYLGLIQGSNWIFIRKNAKIYLPTQIQSGYQWVFAYGVTLSLGLGIVKLNSISDNIITLDNIIYEVKENQFTFFRDFSINLRFGIGYSW